MSWSIGIHKNTLLVTGATVSKFNKISAERDEYALEFSFADTNGMHNVYFNYDYMEYMDVLNEPWISELIIGDPKNAGEVIFMSAEGDNAGDIWGYRYENGECTHLTGTIVITDTVY